MDFKLSTSLIDSIPTDLLTDLSADAAEILLDNNLADGLLKDIPWFGTIIKIYKTGRGFREYFFDKKVLAFLFNLKDISKDERENFIKKNFSDRIEKQKMGEKLLHYLDRFEDIEKSILLSNAFKAYINSLISQSEFFDLSYAIDKFKIHYSWNFLFQCKGLLNLSSELEREHYVSCGLLTDGKGTKSLFLTNSKRYYTLSKTGEDFVKFILNVDENMLKTKYIEAILNMNVISQYGIFDIIIKTKKQTDEYLHSLSNEELFNSTINQINLRFKNNFIIQKINNDEFHFMNNKALLKIE